MASCASRRTSSFFFSIRRSCSISVLTRDVGRVGFTARRLLFLASQEPQVGHTRRIEREAVTLPLDHAFGFELADVGPAAIKVLRYADAETVAFPPRSTFACFGLATDGQSIVTVSAINGIYGFSDRVMSARARSCG